jgi:nitrite reductase (NADH) small subunit
MEVEKVIESEVEIKVWFKAAHVSSFPENAGACVKYNDKQIAVFNHTLKNEWFATQNLCPHKNEMALSRGLIGDKEGEAKVACPFHKKTYSLKTGKCFGDSLYKIDVYPVKIIDQYVYIGIPDEG